MPEVLIMLAMLITLMLLIILKKHITYIELGDYLCLHIIHTYTY